jgi:hypothetical protein
MNHSTCARNKDPKYHQTSHEIDRTHPKIISFAITFLRARGCSGPPLHSRSLRRSRSSWISGMLLCLCLRSVSWLALRSTSIASAKLTNAKDARKVRHIAARALCHEAIDNAACTATLGSAQLRAACRILCSASA